MFKEIKRVNQEYRGLDEVIMALLSTVKDEKLIKTPSLFHSAIYDLKKQDDNLNLFDEFTFDESGITPFSDKLDQVLFRLEISRIIGTNAHNSEALQEAFKRFSLEEQKEIMALGGQMEKILSRLG